MVVAPSRRPETRFSVSGPMGDHPSVNAEALVAIELTDDERYVLRRGLAE